MKRLFLLAVLLAGAATGSAQIGHHPDKPAFAGERLVTEAVTSFHGTYDPATCSLHGLQELEFRNPADTVLGNLSLTYSADWSLTLDSILLFGTPLDVSDIVQESNAMHLRLTQPIPPHQVGFLLLSFTRKKVTTTRHANRADLWQDWLPGVAVTLDGQPVTNDCGELTRVSTRSYVNISIDSSLRIYAGGELINEKEMYGLLPTDRVLLEDIARLGLAADYQTPYAPTFPDGTRRYLLKCETDPTCPMLVGTPTRVDRVTIDSLTIDIVQPRSVSSQEAHRFNQEVTKIAAGLGTRLGMPPGKRLLLYPGAQAFPLITESSLGVNRELQPWKTQRTDLIAALTRWWLSDFAVTAMESDLRRGLVGYVSLAAVYQMYGAESVRLLRKMYDEKEWKKYRRVSDELSAITCPDSLSLAGAQRLFFDDAFRWHTLRGLLGDEVFGALIYAFERARPLTLEVIGAAVPDSAARSARILTDAWRTPEFSESVALVSAASRQDMTTGHWQTTVQVSREGVLALPIEVAIVSTRGDTLLDTIPMAAADRLVSFDSGPMPWQPMWIMLDPFYKLPDFNRHDNRRQISIRQKPRRGLPKEPASLGAVLFEQP
jgi:hypothetical protein